MRMQTLLHAVFPPECLGCGALVESDFSICGACWSDTPFIFDASCDLCGVGLDGQAAGDERLLCEPCHAAGRPWEAGRSVFHYAGAGRKLVLGLKHGDRAEVARAAGPWMARAGADLWHDDPLLVPIPLHWRRLAKRRFNQSALLAASVARATGLCAVGNALIRPRATGSQDGRNHDERFANVADAIRAHPRHGKALNGRAVVLVDDVFTSGATFAAAAEACRAAGASPIRVIALARVARDV